MPIFKQILKSQQALVPTENVDILLPDFEASEVEMFLQNLYTRILTNDSAMNPVNQLQKLLRVFDFPEIPGRRVLVKTEEEDSVNMSTDAVEDVPQETCYEDPYSRSSPTDSILLVESNLNGTLNYRQELGEDPCDVVPRLSKGPS